MKGCSSKVVGGCAVTQLKFNTAFDPGSNTKTYFAVLTMHDESTVLAYHSKIQMVLLWGNHVDVASKPLHPLWKLSYEKKI